MELKSDDIIDKLPPIRVNPRNPVELKPNDQAVDNEIYAAFQLEREEPAAIDILRIIVLIDVVTVVPVISDAVGAVFVIERPTGVADAESDGLLDALRKGPERHQQAVE